MANEAGDPYQWQPGEVTGSDLQKINRILDRIEARTPEPRKMSAVASALVMALRDRGYFDTYASQVIIDAPDADHPSIRFTPTPGAMARGAAPQAYDPRTELGGSTGQEL